ncbi:uncharacterized [Tachysurus ichikawai]
MLQVSLKANWSKGLCGMLSWRGMLSARVKPRAMHCVHTNSLCDGSGFTVSVRLSSSRKTMRGSAEETAQQIKLQTAREVRVGWGNEEAAACSSPLLTDPSIPEKQRGGEACKRVSDVMSLAGEVWCNRGRGTQLVDTIERERHICLGECRQPPLLSLLSSSGLFSLRHCVMEEPGGSEALLHH